MITLLKKTAVINSKIVFILILTAVSSFEVSAQNSTNASETKVTVSSRENVKQSFILVEPISKPGVAVIFLPGGPGTIRIKETQGKPTFNQVGFLQRSRHYFSENGMAVAIADTPSDQRELWRDFRMTKNHARDIEVIIDELRKRFGEIPVYILGISRGGLSVAYLAKYLPQKVTGIVAISALFKDRNQHSLENFDWRKLKQRVLMVGHRRDGCSNTPYSETFNVAKENRFDLISAEGGYEDLAKSPRAECGPFAHHNLLGIEKAVSTEIINWILGKSFIAEVSG